MRMDGNIVKSFFITYIFQNIIKRENCRQFSFLTLNSFIGQIVHLLGEKYMTYQYEIIISNARWKYKQIDGKLN